MRIIMKQFMSYKYKFTYGRKYKAWVDLGIATPNVGPMTSHGSSHDGL